jgi:two-component system, cell cycle response regulator DivK
LVIRCPSYGQNLCIFLTENRLRVRASGSFFSFVERQIGSPFSTESAMKCIFLVEDNKDNADLIRDILSESFHIVHFPAADPLLRGLRSKTTLHPDLLLLDISLPGMDGTELLKEIRRHDAFRRVPAIALTAHAMTNDRERFLRDGFDDYVSKPIVDETLLLDAIANLIPADADANTRA